MAITMQRTRDPALWARVLNLLLGVWLVISAFVWPHQAAERLDTWIVGLWIVGFSLLAIVEPATRWLNTLAAIWLFFASLVIWHTEPATVWNNVIVAIVVFALSLVGAGGERRFAPRRPVGV